MTKQEFFSATPWIYDETTPSKWNIINRSFGSYLDDFNRVDIDRKIEKKLSQTPNPVIIDFMATTTALSTLNYVYLNGENRGKLIAVGMDDTRPEEKRLQEAERGITFLMGDLNLTETWNQLEAELDGAKADLIMERAYGGLNFVPTELQYQRRAMSRMWDMLDPEGGLLALQTPPEEIFSERGIPISQWLNQLTNAGIYYHSIGTYPSIDQGLCYGLLLMQKDPKHPQLPDVTKTRRSRIKQIFGR